jgi:acyl-CoA thioesterase-1
VLNFKTKTVVLAAIIAFSPSSFADTKIVAIGTSNTNCKGVPSDQGFTASLERHLKAAGVDARVINAGKNGDTPAGMSQRLDNDIDRDTQLVLFEPGANRVKSDSDRAENIKYVNDILQRLQDKKIPVIFQSHYKMHSEEEAAGLAKSRGAYYYGHIIRNIPVNQEYRQYDMPGGHTLDPNSAGHLSAKGCALWAEQLVPLVKKVLAEQPTKK